MVLNQELKKKVRILVPETWNNDQKGNFFEEVAGKLLRGQRFRINQRVRFTGMEIDLLADNIDNNQRAFVECKFESQSISANIIDTLMGKAARRGVDLAYLFSTSPPGKEAKGVIDELQRRQPKNLPRFAFIGPDAIAGMFVDVYNVKPCMPEQLNQASIASATLFISPQISPFWGLEEHQDGIPYRAILQSSSENAPSSLEDMKKILKDQEVYKGLELIEVPTSVLSSKNLKTEEEVVTLVNVADALDDYRPCRPSDFVGRYEVQKRIWDFLKHVREDTTVTRILALSGPSGYGKSSVVLKLSDRFRNKKWANKFYLYPVDVRSARGPLFVAKALKIALETAIKQEFIPTTSTDIIIESTESFLQSRTIQSALEALQKSRRVLVIFFDQFEELFTKNELLSTFEAFKQLAFEVHSARTNLVVGFSWRSGITLSDDNPAYHVWHGLKDFRMDIMLDEFTSAEASQLVGLFERDLDKKLLPPLRRRLLEQGQGLPWLLKKLCIHIYREIREGTRQEELLSRRLNVKSLFDEDLQPLTESQIQCLHYIATNSPIDTVDLFEQYEQKTVSQLYNNRLIVRAGQKYAVYWDIFRDYLVDQVVPPIPWTYVPTVQFSMAIRAFHLLRDSGPLNLNDLAEKLGYAESTVRNIVSDLENFLLADRDKEGQYNIRSELKAASSEEVAEFVRKQLHEHILIQTLYSTLEPGKTIIIDEFKHIIERSYTVTSLSPKTLNVYSNRLLPWFRFAGLLESSADYIIRPQEIGEEFAILDSGRRRGEPAGWFMCFASPKRVVDLAANLAREDSLLRSSIFRNKNRNAANDLITLGLAVWQGEYLKPKDVLFKPLETSRGIVYTIVRDRALSSEFLKKIRILLKNNPNDPIIEVGKKLANELHRNWSDKSALRYASAGRRWLNFFSSPEAAFSSIDMFE